MKENGIDLQKQYSRTLQLQQVIGAKVKKRYDFLIKNTPKELLSKANRDFITKGNETTHELLERIITIEKLYTDQSKQLDMFKIE